MKRLHNKVAIVTGGATGIGEAISKKFAQEGALVIVNGFKEDPVDDVVAKIIAEEGFAIALTGDISIEEIAKKCVDKAIEEFGRLDILINNAGVFPVMSVINEYPFEAFDYLIKNNIRSAFNMTLYAIPHLQKAKGVIVCAGSEAGKNGLPENAPYAGTKGFMHAFTRSIALEQAKYGIRANCVCPGAIDTAWTHKETGPMTSKNEKMTIAATPMGRRGTPEEIANAYLFLASDEASFVTGALFSVDGGITINKGGGDEVPAKIAKEPKGSLKLEHSKDGAPQMIKGEAVETVISEVNLSSQSPNL